MKIITFYVLIIFMIFSLLTSCEPGGGGESTAYIIDEVELIYQHKGTTNLCIPGNDSTEHDWFHAKGSDDVFGNANDCPHCSTYCAPASIAMIAKAYGKTGNFIKQDIIYEIGTETALGTVDNQIATHGVGMFDSSSGNDQTMPALVWALDGIPCSEFHGGDPALLNDLKNLYITQDFPVLWLDHGGWPSGMHEEFPAEPGRSEQGHAKVIAGYDDRGSADPADDLFLIFDPWPEYNFDEILPAGAIQGPGGSYDPYWLDANAVVADVTDIFLIPNDSINP